MHALFQKLKQTRFINIVKNGEYTINKYISFTIETSRVIFTDKLTNQHFDISYYQAGIYKGIDKCYYSDNKQSRKLTYFCFTLISGEGGNNDKINRNLTNVILTNKAEKTILRAMMKISHQFEFSRTPCSLLCFADCKA